MSELKWDADRNCFVTGELMAEKQARLAQIEAGRSEFKSNRAIDDAYGRLGVLRAQLTAEQATELPPRIKLTNLHRNLTERALELMNAKNQHYASSTDPFRNFRQFGLLGILVRLSDKLSRLRTFEEAQTQPVGDEHIEDTILDTINYAVLYIAMWRQLDSEKKRP